MCGRCQLTTAAEPACTEHAVVRIEDRTGVSAAGCERHGARALAAITDARVYPLPGHDGAAIAVHRAAKERKR